MLHFLLEFLWNLMPTIIGFATATPQEKDAEQNPKPNLQKIELYNKYNIYPLVI